MSKFQCFSYWIVVILVILLGEQALVAQKSDKATPPDPEAQKTHRVSVGPLEVAVDLKGAFEANDASEVVVRPKTLKTLVVERAVTHGASVKKGTPLVWLDTRAIDEQITTLSRDIRLSELTRHKAEADLLMLQKTTPLDIAVASQTEEVAADELRFFLNVGKEQEVDSAKNSLKSAQFQLEYTREELEQLEKMYKADDLTEETEEIILKRARRSVESAERYLGIAEVNTARRLTTLIPRQEKTLVQAATRATLTLANARTSLAVALKKAQIEFAKTNDEVAKLKQQLSELNEDRRQMPIRSPSEGVVYYGRCVRGKWVDKAKLDGQLRRGGSLTSNQVVVTVVKSRRLSIRADLAEKELYRVRKGLSVQITPTAFPEMTIQGKIASVSRVPIASNVFDCRISVHGKVIPELLGAGMTCAAKVLIADKVSAVTVPTAAVFKRRGQSYVYILSAGHGHRKRTVVAGHQAGERIEIIEGLKEGDEILLQKPMGGSDD